MIYPWQQAQWAHLQQRCNEKSLAHAFLFSGPAGVGKNDFASAFANSLLCSQPKGDGQACKECNSCRWMSSGAHPDSIHIGLEGDSKVIGVDQIRSLGHFLSLKSQQGRYKVIVITPAEKMNVNAANSLLKSIEEPAENTIIILVSSSITALPATVRSRCQKLEFPYPVHDEALAWLTQAAGTTSEDPNILLSIAKGAPLHALTMASGDILKQRSAFFADLLKLAEGAEHPIKIGEKWLKQDIYQILSWFHGALADMIKLNMLEKQVEICHVDYIDALQSCATRLDLVKLYRCYEHVGSAQQMLKANMNPQLLLESILIPWADINTGLR